MFIKCKLYFCLTSQLHASFCGSGRIVVISAEITLLSFNGGGI